jgi:hypothetical protein
MRTKAQRFSQGTEVMKINLELFGGAEYKQCRNTGLME